MKKQPEDNSSSAGVSTLSMTMGSFPLLRVIGRTFGPITSRSPATIVRHELVTPSSVLLAPPVSSPCLDANGGIDIL